MKLDELRRFDFVNKIIEIQNKTKYWIHGDQDMINLLFHNQTGRVKFLKFQFFNIEMTSLFSINIDLVKQFDCTHNFFPNVYCNKTNECHPKNGIKIVHGVTNQFEINQNSFFGSLARKLIDVNILLQMLTNSKF